MLNLNNVVIAGNLGADPETRYFPDGTPICTYRVATTTRYKNKQTGELKESTEWHTIQTMGRRAELDQQYLRKGSGVYVEGSLRTRKFKDKETQKDRFMTSVVGRVVQFTGSKPKDAPDQAQQEDYPEEFEDDSIPF